MSTKIRSEEWKKIDFEISAHQIKANVQQLTIHAYQLKHQLDLHPPEKRIVEYELNMVNGYIGNLMKHWYEYMRARAAKQLKLEKLAKENTTS